VFDPPPGYADMEGDAATAPHSENYETLDVPEVGAVQARRPRPNAIPALVAASIAPATGTERRDQTVRFVYAHLGEGELERIYVAMMIGEAPADSIERIARAVATWGTARPTSPSSRLAC
jgi:hypothetical protein